MRDNLTKFDAEDPCDRFERELRWHDATMALIFVVCLCLLALFVMAVQQ